MRYRLWFLDWTTLTRRFRAVPLKEITLWQMFDCLADGLAMLQNGMECQIDRLGRTTSFSTAGWDTMVHMDLKPVNSTATLDV